MSLCCLHKSLSHATLPTVSSMNVYVPSHPLTTKRVAGSKTHLFHSPLPTSENPINNNHLITPVLTTHTRTNDPSTAIQLSLNTFETILAPEVSLERPTTRQSTTNPIPPATVGSVGEYLPLRLVLPFRTIVIVSGSRPFNHRLPDLPGQGVPMMPFPLFNQGCRTPINFLPTISHLRVRHNRSRNPFTRNNTFVTTHPTSLWTATARGTVGRTRGRMTLWSETNLTITRLPHTNTPYNFHLPGLRDLRQSKRRAFLPARSEEFITIRG